MMVSSLYVPLSLFVNAQQFPLYTNHFQKCGGVVGKLKYLTFTLRVLMAWHQFSYMTFYVTVRVHDYFVLVLKMF